MPLDIPKATPRRVAEIVHRIERDLKQPRLTYKQRNHILDTVLHAGHQEFIPLTLKLLDRDCPNYTKAKFIPYIYDCARTPAQAHAALVDYVSAPHPVAAENVFWYCANLRWRSSWAYVSLDLPRRGSLLQRFIFFAVQPRQWLIVRRLIEYVRVKRLTLPASLLRRLCRARTSGSERLPMQPFPSAVTGPGLLG